MLFTVFLVGVCDASDSSMKGRMHGRPQHTFLAEDILTSHNKKCLKSAANILMFGLKQI